MIKNILAINPWIYDFAAYDFWLKPYGFLSLLTYLSKKGSQITYIDCLDKKISCDRLGRGKYYSEIIEKPPVYKSIPRYFKRYGITPDEFEKRIIESKADYVLITSSMTYWYPAIIDAVRIIRKHLPDSKVILGGTYATLCLGHAKKNIPCDFVFPNESLKEFFKLMDIEFKPYELYSTLPDYENFYSNLDYVVMRTSWGCPYECSFCAIKKLCPESYGLKSNSILDFINKYAGKGIKNFVLYDDAFLYDQKQVKLILNYIIDNELDISFHTPNALHLRFVDYEIARLLKKAGFINPHFGLETLNPRLQKSWGDKADRNDLLRAVGFLKKAGFRNGEFSVYLLLGFPGQNIDELKQEVEFLNSQGAKVSLAEFSPVPQTRLYKKYSESFSEPLMHNNSIFASLNKTDIKEFWDIKNYVRGLNQKLKTG
ncbi:MAG: radical SAM protein [Candidatus Omnitrophota bacterium]